MIWRHSALGIWLIALLAVGSGCGNEDAVPQATPAAPEALIVISPHPDDETIFGGGTIHRLASDPSRYVHAIYLSGGDRSTVPGPCNGIPEKQKIEQIIALRERETRAAWNVLVPERPVPIDFLRGPDQGLVTSSTLVGGLRVDTLSTAGTDIVGRAVALATQLPPAVRKVLFLTTAKYDAHPDHRTAYYATRQAAQVLHDSQQLDVRIWSWIVHDEIPDVNFPFCCPGDAHWPAAGPKDDYLALTDVPARPRPPLWNHVEDVSDLVTVRHDALAQHVSQVIGYPPLCMPVYIPDFYTRWTEKIEEPFYEETL